MKSIFKFHKFTSSMADYRGPIAPSLLPLAVWRSLCVCAWKIGHHTRCIRYFATLIDIPTRGKVSTGTTRRKRCARWPRCGQEEEEGGREKWWSTHWRNEMCINEAPLSISHNLDGITAISCFTKLLTSDHRWYLILIMKWQMRNDLMYNSRWISFHFSLLIYYSIAQDNTGKRSFLVVQNGSTVAYWSISIYIVGVQNWCEYFI